MMTNKKRIKTSLQRFQNDGDLESLIHDLSDDNEGANPLIVLQHALQSVEDADLRDTIDDIAWAIANQCPVNSKPPGKKLDAIEKKAIEEYGPLITKILPGLRDFVSGILSATEAPITKYPTENAVTAAIGMRAQESAVQVRVECADAGEEKRFFQNECKKCGGEKKAGGYIVCENCSERARKELGERIFREKIQEEIKTKSAEERMQIDMEAAIANMLPDLKKYIDLSRIPMSMIADFMLENPDRYNCGKCSREPVKDCACAMKIKVPDRLKDRIIVEGVRPATGELFYAMLLLNRK